MRNFSDVVQVAFEQIKSERSITIPKSDERGMEELKALLTRRAGYLCSLQDPNVGLLRKDGGNRSIIQHPDVGEVGMSVDVLMDRTNGQWSDIASSREDGDSNTLVALWQPQDADPNGLADWLARWLRAPKELAGFPDGGVPNQPPNNPPPPPNTDDLRVLLQTALVTIQAQNDLLVTMRNEAATRDAAMREIMLGIAQRPFPAYGGKIFGVAFQLNPIPR